MRPPLPVYQVSDLLNEMRSLMEASYPEIWIEGELSSLSQPASGHLYFTLKDENSQLKCAMFRGRASLSRYKAKVGDLVRVRAKISIYTARGDLQCIVQHIEDAGEGILQRRFEDLKEKLNQEGLFDASRKLAIPRSVKHLAVVTSPTGAAINDILSTLERRSPGIPITIYPAVVQGEAGSQSLIQSLRDVVQHSVCDVIILGRGGGSLEDLWCFNDEALAREIVSCPIPIVCAVGHEVDISIADYVADLRAPTPTAAAELVSSDNSADLRHLASLAQRLKYSLSRQLEKLAQQVDLSFQQLQHPKARIQADLQQLGQTSRRLKQAMAVRLDYHSRDLNHHGAILRSHPPQTLIASYQKDLSLLINRLARAKKNGNQQVRQKLAALGAQLNLVSPLATLDRGFSITRDESGKIIRQSSSSEIGKMVEISLKSGGLLCKVQGILK